MNDDSTTEPLIQIGADGVDVDAVVAAIRQRVQDKIDQGIYPDPDIARAERHNLSQLRDHDAFMDYYMSCLRQAAYVDINEFEIRERRSGPLAPLLVRFKKMIWKLLVFYTYRLWSQQNQVNGLLVAAVDGADRKHAEKVRKLEARIEQLEKALAAKSE